MSSIIRLIATGLAVTCFVGPVVAASEKTVPNSCDRQLVMQIDSAMVSVEADGVTINAFGVAESAGWGGATLVVVGQIANGAATVDFVACRPEVSAQVLTPIQTRTKLALAPDVRMIVIRAKTNTMNVEIVRR
ncbi:MAG: hypothetical protein ABL996_10795 [Micropepsaceae bacterium]